MTKLYQVISSFHDYDYHSVKPVFNSLDIEKAITKALTLLDEKFLTSNIYDFQEFAHFDREFFSNFKTNSHIPMQNIHIIEVNLDEDVKDIHHYSSKDITVWKITKETVCELFVKKIIKLYADNQFSVTEKEATELFYRIVKSPKCYIDNADVIDEDANSKDNIEHIHYFEKYEKK